MSEGPSINDAAASDVMGVLNTTSFTASCHEPDCKWRKITGLELVAKCLAVWHVYEKHPEKWKAVAGDRPPKDPDPRTDEGLATIIAYVANQIFDEREK